MTRPVESALARWWRANLAGDAPEAALARWWVAILTSDATGCDRASEAFLAELVAQERYVRSGGRA